MTTIDKTKAGRRRGRRAVMLSAAVERVQEPIAASAGNEPVMAETSGGIASTSGMHGVTEATKPGGEDKSADEVVAADDGNGVIPVGIGVSVGESTLYAGAPRETGRQGRHAKQQRPGSKASASSPPTNVPAGKNARIAELVSRPEGAGIDELMAATGWQRHTIRAALTRLRQSGFTVELRTGEDGRRAYHHVDDAEVAS